MTRGELKVVGFVIFILLCSMLGRGDGQAPSGEKVSVPSNVWQMMDDSAKFGYLLGFSNASEYYQMVLRAERNGCSDETKDRINAFLDSNPVSVQGATLGQWKLVVDEFYKDPRNKGVNLVFAMRIASLQIAGRPQSEIEGQLERMRELSIKP